MSDVKYCPVIFMEIIYINNLWEAIIYTYTWIGSDSLCTYRRVPHKTGQFVGQLKIVMPIIEPFPTEECFEKKIFF